MRSLFMQEFSPIFACWLLESFTTVSWRTTWPVSQNSRSCCPTLTVNHSYASRMPFLKRLTVSFLQRVTHASLKNSFQAIGLLCKTCIFRPALRVILANGLLALKAEIFLQLLISSFTEPYWPFECFPIQPVTLHPPRRDQEQSQGSFIEEGCHMMSKRFPLDTLFLLVWWDKTILLYAIHEKCCPFHMPKVPTTLSPFQKLAIPFSGTASQCNLLQGVPPWGIGVGEGQI